MKALVSYMDRINAHLAIFGEAPLDPYRDYAEVRRAVEVLGSPEILSMDGELSRAETEHRTNEWLDAIMELNAIEQELTA